MWYSIKELSAVRFSKVSLISIAFLLLLQSCGLRAEPSATLAPTGPDSTVPTMTPAREFEFRSIPLRSGFGFRSHWLELYFTDPTSSFSAEKSGGLDGPVAAAIVAARESVDVALNSLGVNSLTDALIRAHNRGITVRVVMETNNTLDRLNPQQLKDAGIPIVDDNGSGIMNNTFVVIDQNQVWTGSITYTSSGLFKADNTLVRIFSEEIAENYTKEFEEMFSNNQFGAYVVPETPNPSVLVEGTQVEVLFSPDDVVAKRLSSLLGEARESIYFMAYSFTSNTLGSLIRDKAAQGVTVVGIMESSQIDTADTG